MSDHTDPLPVVRVTLRATGDLAVMEVVVMAVKRTGQARRGPDPAAGTLDPSVIRPQGCPLPTADEVERGTRVGPDRQEVAEARWENEGGRLLRAAAHGRTRGRRRERRPG
ncbi:hypothetical protein GCM10023199_50540 [Actinomycetospora chibensis]